MNFTQDRIQLERTIIECAEQNALTIARFKEDGDALISAAFMRAVHEPYALTQLGVFKDNGRSEDAMGTIGEIDKRSRLAMRDTVTSGGSNTELNQNNNRPTIRSIFESIATVRARTRYDYLHTSVCTTAPHDR